MPLDFDTAWVRRIFGRTVSLPKEIAPLVTGVFDCVGTTFMDGADKGQTIDSATGAAAGTLITAAEVPAQKIWYVPFASIDTTALDSVHVSLQILHPLATIYIASGTIHFNSGLTGSIPPALTLIAPTILPPFTRLQARTNIALATGKLFSLRYVAWELPIGCLTAR